MELRSGAITRPQRTALADLVGPFRDRGRLLGVSASAYFDAGRLLSTLRREGYTGATLTPSFVQDVVLAASVREIRGVLVTDNAGDFASIRRHLSGFQFVAPWP
jgi:predicted nucleic acid-binding protein